MIRFTSSALVRERERGNRKMLINTPARPMELKLGKIIPCIFIGLPQVVIILGSDTWCFKFPSAGIFLAANCCSSVPAVTWTGAFHHRQDPVAGNANGTVRASAFPLLFPYEGMPLVAQHIAETLPATHFIRGIRGLVPRDAKLVVVYRDAFWLFDFFALGLTIAALRIKKRFG